ncbi:DNA-protecting protein DprA [Flavobacterium sp. xlx-214]|uniref:DNA-processing protein DprA n=1 Tax=unclassified Flavobacterium TaxID=196869 RepID=UPI0013D41160|nr:MULTISPECIES: DNA-processing protein DprA [unclassified Flavobacterium]MBA5792041.1 DNA-protecting protein DprA [Flavobacterium sp. xlx-221]QMI84292.1 DNA-protecting protein DprA [Flavobacterium sp. xlx-214]
MNTQTLTSYLKILACDGLGVVNARKLLEASQDVTAIFESDFLDRFLELTIPPSIKKLIQEDHHSALIQDELQFIQENNIQCVGFLDNAYPKLLKECADAPVVLFYKGNLNLLQNDCLSVVGTRKISSFGKEMVQNLMTSVAPYNPTIVSGMAYGVDICAYAEARKNKLGMVGVMGTSFKTLYPSAHKKLYYDLFENGLVITEYAGFNTHVPELFTRRNRIIAGLSKATVVVESAEKGGSLITAYFANDYAREVYAIPGRMTDEFSKGCLRLIHENRAQVLYDFNHLIDDLNWNKEIAVKVETEVKKQIDLNQFSAVQQTILKCLQEKELHIDELALQTQLEMATLNAELMMLELDSVVIGLPGKMFKLKY